MTNIQDAYPLFLAHGRAERHYAKETLGKLKDCCTAWILPHLGYEDLANLSNLDVLAFRSRMVDAHLGVTGIQHPDGSEIVSQVLPPGAKINCLDPNEIHLPQRPKPHVHYLTNEEVDRLVAVINTHTFTGLRMRVLVEALLTTGMRISEALSLDRTPFEMGQTQVVIAGKGGKPRTIFFPESTLFWIKKWLYHRRDDFPALFVTTGIPRRLDRGDMSKYFKELRARLALTSRLPRTSCGIPTAPTC